MLFAPGYAAVNVTGRFKVRLFPDVETVAAATPIEH
jgi:hypothetical protein